jgi:hypothetical protein
LISEGHVQGKNELCAVIGRPEECSTFQALAGVEIGNELENSAAHRESPFGQMPV